MRNILFVLFIVYLSSCEPTLLAEFEDKPVVTCYLEAGISPIVSISKIIAFRDDVTYSDEDVNKLSITITDDAAGIAYEMESLGDGKYNNPNLIVSTDGKYSLKFMYNGELITSETTIPDCPENVEFSDTSIGIVASYTKAPGRGIEITWTNDDSGYFIVEGITESTRKVVISADNPAKGFQLDYTQGSSATLSSENFNYFGDYEVSVIHIQSEYVIMSQGSGNSSTSLIDIKGNISGGYGIFSGINRSITVINVYEETMPSMP